MTGNSETDMLQANETKMAGISHDQLFDLYTHYETVVKDQLDFCFKYLNFYVGLLSVILGGTLTALFTFKPSYPVGYALLLSPLIMLVLASMGYRNVYVFYRRFLEAWMTVLNIQAMLGLRETVVPIEGSQPPLYKSQYDQGFITQFERPAIRKILDTHKGKSSAEMVLNDVLKHGDTLWYARLTFISFGAASLAVLVIIIFVVHFDLFQS